MVILLLQCLPRLPWHKLQCWTLCDSTSVYYPGYSYTESYHLGVAQYIWVSCSLVYASYVKSELLTIWETNVPIITFY